MRIQPKGGVNLRLPAYQTPRNQWLLMQNMDMTHDEVFTQIKGSAKHHGTNLGTNPPTAILPYYDNNLGTAHDLVCVDDKILKKIEGTNEYQTLYSGLTPNKIRFATLVDNKMFIAHPIDGLFQYDGVIVSLIIGSPKLTDIIFTKEINRAFGIAADIPNGIFYTDDISTSGGVPILWNPLNADTVPPTDGDVIEKLWFLNGRLIYLMSNSTWIEYVNGAPTNWRYEKSPTVVGWTAPKTIRQVGLELWGLGFSPYTGRGVYAFNGISSRLLSLDVEPILDRINDNLIHEACAEHVDNIYKLSFALDSATQNDTTLHVDTIFNNQETERPNFYGPHTYGFHSSAVLNTRKFKGQHLFGTLFGGGSWVFEVGNFNTQHASGMNDDGDLIPVVLLSGIHIKDDINGQEFDETWFKRYSNFFLTFPPGGTWSATIDILKAFSSETYTTYEQFMNDASSSVEALVLGSTPLDQFQYSIQGRTQHVLSQGIQLRVSNLKVGTKSAFSAFLYDVRPRHRVKVFERVTIP